MGNCVDARSLDRAYGENENLKKKLNELGLEKESDLRKYFDRELQILQEGYKEKRNVEDHLRAEMREMAANYQADIKLLQEELMNGNNERIRLINECRESNKTLLDTHIDAVIKLEEQHKLVIKQKDEEILQFHMAFTTLQKEDNERLDNYLKKHSNDIDEMKAEKTELMQKLGKLQGEYLSLLKKVAEEKENHLMDIKDYEKRLGERRRVYDQGKFILHHTFIIQPSQNNEGIHSPQAFEALAEGMKSTLEQFGAKLTTENIDDYSNCTER